MSDQLELDPSWPGLNAPADRVEVDVDALLALAEELESEADFLSGNGAGTPARLEADTSLACPGFGSWQTAQEMETGHTHARSAVVGYFHELVGVMRETARLFRETARTHAENDQALQDTWRQHETTLG